MMVIKKLLANPKNYGRKRSRKKVAAIVIHGTGNKNDTALNNAKYFKNNVTKTSAHFFVDRDGRVYKSVNMNRTAYSVGGSKYNNGGGVWYGSLTNSNTVSIEMCDVATRDPSAKQVNALKALVKYVKKKCPNANIVCRHYDINGKQCPNRFIDIKKWYDLLSKII